MSPPQGEVDWSGPRYATRPGRGIGGEGLLLSKPDKLKVAKTPPMDANKTAKEKNIEKLR